MWPAFPDLQAPLGSALDPEVKEPVAFTGVTKMAECGLDKLLASLNPMEPDKEDSGSHTLLASQV
jgi:hypothetical protein